MLYTINLYEYFPLPAVALAVSVTLPPTFTLAVLAVSVDVGLLVASIFTLRASLLTVLHVVLSFNN